VMNENNTRRAPDIEMMRVKHFQTYLKAFKGRSISFNEHSVWRYWEKEGTKNEAQVVGSRGRVKF